MRTSSSSRMALILGLWTTVLLIALRGEISEAKSDLQIIKYRYPQLFPERFGWDPRHKRFILGSTVLGKLVTLTEAGVVEDFISDEEFEGKAEIFGVFVDASRNRVLAVLEVGGGETDAADAKLVAYDLSSKRRTLTVVLNEEGHAGNFLFKDLCVDHQGNAYVTEPFGNAIWKVTSSGEKSFFVGIPQRKVIVQGAGLDESGINGIVYNDGFLLVNQFNSGALFRVKVSDRKVDQVKVGDGLLMAEADGMNVRQDGALVVVSAQTAWLLSSRDYWQSASLVDSVVLKESTFSTGVATKDLQIYVLSSYRHENLGGVKRESFRVEEIEFPADTANNPLYLLVILGAFGLLVLVWKFQVNQFNKNYTKKNF